MKEGQYGYIFGTNPGSGSIVGISTGIPGNLNVSWEKAQKANVGLELGLFDQLKFQLDYFYEKRTGIYIQQESVPSIVGLNETQYVNLGEMKNQGFDGSMSMNNDLMTGMSLPVPISLTIEIKSCMMINRLLYGPTKVKLDLPIVSNAVL